MNRPSVLIEFFGDSPFLRILDHFIDRRPFDCSKEEVITETGIARNSLFTLWEKVEKYGLVKRTRTVGRTTMYTLDVANPIVKAVLAFDWELAKHAAPKPRAIAIAPRARRR